MGSDVAYSTLIPRTSSNTRLGHHPKAMIRRPSRAGRPGEIKSISGGRAPHDALNVREAREVEVRPARYRVDLPVGAHPGDDVIALPERLDGLLTDLEDLGG